MAPPTHDVGGVAHLPSLGAIMSQHDFSFVPRPVVRVGDRPYLLLDDLRPTLGVQLLAAADLTSLLGMVAQDECGSVPVWYDGSGVCYVSDGSSAPRRLPVVDLPLWIALDIRRGLGQMMMPA